jgi:hypothetical protein
MPSSQKPPRVSPNHSLTIPETNQPIRNPTELKAFVRKILLASPAFPRFCADYLEPHGANRQQVMDLAEKYQKNYRGDMSIPNPKSCTHIKVDGVCCKSPALRGEQFCYFHQRMVRGVRTPPNARLHPIAQIESPEAIQASLMEVINALARNQIDVKRAELMLRALHIAVKNARNVHFGLCAEKMVSQVPEYPVAPAVSSASPRGKSEAPGNGHLNDSSLNLPATAAESFEPPASGSSFKETWKRGGEEIKRQAAEISAAREREAWRATHPGVDPLSPKPPLGIKDATPAKRKPSGAVAG